MLEYHFDLLIKQKQRSWNNAANLAVSQERQIKLRLSQFALGALKLSKGRERSIIVAFL